MKVTFDTICGGELAEKFKMVLAQIGRNVMNPNMDPEAARGMTINIKFKPNESGLIETEAEIKIKLAGFKKTITVFMIGQDSRTGRIEMSEYGNNRPKVTAVAVEPATVDADPDFDPSTGEIYEEPRRGPIDLRAAK